MSESIGGGSEQSVSSVQPKRRVVPTGQTRTRMLSAPRVSLACTVKHGATNEVSAEEQTRATAIESACGTTTLWPRVVSANRRIGMRYIDDRGSLTDRAQAAGATRRGARRWS